MIMKKKAMAALFLNVFGGSLLAAQSLQVMKPPGSPVVVSWAFPSTQESQITGFVLQSSPSTSGPWVDGPVAIATARALTFTSPATPTFYQLLTYKDVTGQPRAYSQPSNIVAAGILLPPPLGLGAL